MAFAYDTLARTSAGDASGISQSWNYSTSDTKATVIGANYWSGAYARGVRAGDFINCKCSDGGQIVYMSALAATTSTSSAIGGAAAVAATAPVWVGPIACTGYGTAGRVGAFLAPIAGTMTTIRHITDEVVDGDVVLNLDVAGTNATGTVTIAVSDTAVDIIDAGTVTAGGVVTAGQLVKVESDGGGTVGAGRLWVLITP